MESATSWRPVVLIGLFLFSWTAAVSAQKTPDSLDIPSQFKLDMETAARLKPQLMAQSVPSIGSYTIGRLVFERLVKEMSPSSTTRFAWQMRIVENDQLNAYSSPDGTVYVENGLAKLAGTSAGLWAAILSHEIAHVMRRDWARRYLYQKYLESGNGAGITLGDPSLPSGNWMDSEKASADFGRFCRQMELEADREGLMLMARAGYHPAFVPALHHLLHASAKWTTSASLYAMHPCWQERDHDLAHAYVDASIDFERRWPEWYASPGGNPPIVVFAEQPTVKKTGSHEWQLHIAMRCENLAGAVEVVLRADPSSDQVARHGQLSPPDDPGSELRQLTGCTSPTTTVVFDLADYLHKRNAADRSAEVYVLDSWGTVLARADVPKLPR